jgi:hypothetical protein
MVALKIKEGMYGVKDVTVERKEIQTYRELPRATKFWWNQDSRVY